MINIQSVTYDYGSGTRALEDVSIEFPRGRISAVLGESGSGKTTLLMCLGRFLAPSAGEITYDGRAIGELPEPEFRKAVGIVFQKLYLFPHLTVLENMTLAKRHVQNASKPSAEGMAMEMLERLGIPEIAEDYPAQISGGQAQRAAIARGLMLEPDYMLLDEPTSALDANTTGEFAEWLIDLRERTNFIIVTHDIRFARQAADSGIYLSQGRALDAGSIEDIIRHVEAGELVDPAGAERE